MICRYYQVAGFDFSVHAHDDSWECLNFASYEAFVVDGSQDELFHIAIEKWQNIPKGFTEIYRQSEGGGKIIYGSLSHVSVAFVFYSGNSLAGWLKTTDQFRDACLFIAEGYEKLAFDNATMIMFSLATARQKTALFHASVVSRNGFGYLFLGKSGTGKSTHSRLWLKHLDGTELVNDDNPVVRIVDDEVRVYGTPWSGKTPCYRNVSYPVGGIVLLSQASINQIKRMNNIQAYASLMISISGMRWNRQLADGLDETEKLLISKVPMWHLECLPDADAAMLCASTVEKRNCYK